MLLAGSDFSLSKEKLSLTLLIGLEFFFSLLSDPYTFILKIDFHFVTGCLSEVFSALVSLDEGWWFRSD